MPCPNCEEIVIALLMDAHAKVCPGKPSLQPKPVTTKKNEQRKNQDWYKLAKRLEEKFTVPSALLCSTNEEDEICPDIELLYDTYDEIKFEEGKDCSYFGPTKDGRAHGYGIKFQKKKSLLYYLKTYENHT